MEGIFEDKELAAHIACVSILVVEAEAVYSEAAVVGFDFVAGIGLDKPEALAGCEEEAFVIFVIDDGARAAAYDLGSGDKAGGGVFL